MKEGKLKNQVEEFLTYQQNMGKLIFARLNCGDFIDKRGGSRRRIKGCPPGWPDFLVTLPMFNWNTHRWGLSKNIALELKSDTGTQSDAQIAFQVMCEAQGWSYFLIRELEQVEAALEG